MDDEEVASHIVDAAVRIHKALGPGLLESAYVAALQIEFTDRRVRHECEIPIQGSYLGRPLGVVYRADVLVEGQVLIEVKSVRVLEPIHVAQLLSYLRLGQWRFGFLLNFNAPLHLIAGFRGKLATARGTIVNVTSGLAIAPRAGGPVYSATKAGLRSLTLGLRPTLAKQGIHLIEALPPVVDTAMTVARSGGKMSAAECARQIVAAIEHDRDEANVGQTKVLRAVYSLSPALARRIMLRF